MAWDCSPGMCHEASGMWENRDKVLWRKGSWGSACHLWGYVAQSVGNQPLLGLLLVEHSSSYGYLDDTNLWLFGSFFLKLRFLVFAFVLCSRFGFIAALMSESH